MNQISERTSICFMSCDLLILAIFQQRGFNSQTQDSFLFLNKRYSVILRVIENFHLHATYIKVHILWYVSAIIGIPFTLMNRPCTIAGICGRAIQDTVNSIKFKYKMFRHSFLLKTLWMNEILKQAQHLAAIKKKFPKIENLNSLKLFI